MLQNARTVCSILFCLLWCAQSGLKSTPKPTDCALPPVLLPFLHAFFFFFLSFLLNFCFQICLIFLFFYEKFITSKQHFFALLFFFQKKRKRFWPKKKPRRWNNYILMEVREVYLPINWEKCDFMLGFVRSQILCIHLFTSNTAWRIRSHFRSLNVQFFSFKTLMYEKWKIFFFISIIKVYRFRKLGGGVWFVSFTSS